MDVFGISFLVYFLMSCETRLVLANLRALWALDRTIWYLNFILVCRFHMSVQARLWVLQTKVIFATYGACCGFLFFFFLFIINVNCKLIQGRTEISIFINRRKLQLLGMCGVKFVRNFQIMEVYHLDKEKSKAMVVHAFHLRKLVEEIKGLFTDL